MADPARGWQAQATGLRGGEQARPRIEAGVCSRAVKGFARTHQSEKCWGGKETMKFFRNSVD
jgi:hypothetical protein